MPLPLWDEVTRAPDWWLRDAHGLRENRLLFLSVMLDEWFDVIGGEANFEPRPWRLDEAVFVVGRESTGPLGIVLIWGGELINTLLFVRARVRFHPDRDPAQEEAVRQSLVGVTLVRRDERGAVVASGIVGGLL